VHQPDRRGLERQGAVQHTRVVPHNEVTLAPLVTQRELGLCRPIHKAVQQRAPLLGRPAHDLVRGGTQKQRLAPIATRPDQRMHSGGDAIPRPPLVVGCVLVGQGLRVRKTVHDLQIGDLGTLVVCQGGVRGIGVGELGVAASRIYCARREKCCFLRVFVNRAVDVPVEISLPV